MKWKRVRIDTCARIVSGATPKTSEPAYWDGRVAWATPKDLSDLKGSVLRDTPRKITEAGLSSCSAEILPTGSVLFSSRAPIGHVAINAIPMATNQGFKSFVPEKEKLDALYLYYWLRANKDYLVTLGNGATFKEVSKEIVSRIEIPLPPLEGQRRIATILDKADALCQKRRLALQKLDSLTQSIFIDLFGDPSKNPQRFPIVSLGDVIHSASDGPHVSPKYCESGIPFLSTRNIRPGGVIWQDMKFISKEEAEVQWRKCRPRRGDLLYTKGGTTGLAAVIDFDESIAVWVHVALLKPDVTKVDPFWLEVMLNTAHCYVQSQRYTHGIANRDLGLSRMVQISHYLPPLARQKEFVRVYRVLQRQGAQSNSSLNDLERGFSSLQQRAFCGEL